MYQMKGEKLTVPNVFKYISEAEDDEQISRYDNTLICMLLSPIMIIGSLFNFLIRYFIFGRNFLVTLGDSLVLLAIGICYEAIMRIDFKLRAKTISHIVSALFAVMYMFVVIRFYELIGPSIWMFCLVPLILSIVQVTRVLWAYASFAMFLSWVYITFFAAKTNTLSVYFYIMGFVFFVFLHVVSFLVFMINSGRIRKIKKQLTEVRKQAEERKKAEEATNYLALYDQLTGLPNKIFFQELLTKAIGKSKSENAELYVMFLDLDMFKMINDTMGHTHGDELLSQVGQRLSDIIKDSGVVSRIGGDEFLIMLYVNEDSLDIKALANAILQRISNPFVINQRIIYISCSIGISKYPPDGCDMDSIIKSADLAMYKAKEEGKNRFIFYSEDLTQIAQYELDMIISMKSALLNNEFELYYQPQFNGMTKEVIGFEALLRWNSPQMGLLYPNEFIPVAEKTGLIIPIGEWVLRTACLQNKFWQNTGVAHVPVAVNLSVNQICCNSLAENISSALRETGLDPYYLQLEITEKILTKDIKKIKNELEKIKKLGVRIAVDDFGTGDSSIYYLKDLPIDCIKIPMEFIHGIDKDVKDESIITVILGLADILKIDVIAEGVENQRQLDFLNKRLCKSIQGFYFSRPVKACDIGSCCSLDTASFVGKRRARRKVAAAK